MLFLGLILKFNIWVTLYPHKVQNRWAQTIFMSFLRWSLLSQSFLTIWSVTVKKQWYCSVELYFFQLNYNSCLSEVPKQGLNYINSSVAWIWKLTANSAYVINCHAKSRKNWGHFTLCLNYKMVVRNMAKVTTIKVSILDQ